MDEKFIEFIELIASMRAAQRSAASYPNLERRERAAHLEKTVDRFTDDVIAELEYLPTARQMESKTS